MRRLPPPPGIRRTAAMGGETEMEKMTTRSRKRTRGRRKKRRGRRRKKRETTIERHTSLGF